MDKEAAQADWDLAFTYGTRDEEAPFSLTLEHRWRATCTGIFGASGSGKSTLLEVLLGLKAKAQVRGRAVCGGHTLFSTETKHWPALRHRGCAWVPQDAALLPHLSAAGNIRLAAKPGIVVAELAAAVGATELLEKRPRQLSGGERQRVALARALGSAHEVLLLDEPLAALDLPRRIALLEVLRRRQPAAPVLYVSHEWREIESLCDYVLMLDQGRLQWAGPPSMRK